MIDRVSQSQTGRTVSRGVATTVTACLAAAFCAAFCAGMSETAAHAGTILPGRGSGARGARHYHHPRPRAMLRPVILRLDPSSYEYDVPHAASGSYPETVPVEISGKRFKRGAAVRWDGKALPTVFVSPQKLQASIPFRSIASALTRTQIPGEVKFNITVSNLAPGGGVSPPEVFTVQVQGID